VGNPRQDSEVKYSKNTEKYFVATGEIKRADFANHQARKTSGANYVKAEHMV
jgi:hypothetical protein